MYFYPIVSTGAKVWRKWGKVILTMKKNSEDVLNNIIAECNDMHFYLLYYHAGVTGDNT